MRKKAVPNGTEYQNKQQTATATIIMEVKSTNRNRMFKCQITNKTGQIEIKELQKCQLINGKFNVNQYLDRELYKIAKILYSNINERIKKKKSYKNVINKFNSVSELYHFLVGFTEKNPHHYKNIIEKKYQADKDILSFFKLEEGKKEYSQDTLIFISQDDNNAVRAIINRNISREEKEKKLNQILNFYNFN